MRKTLWIIVIIVVILVGLWLWRSRIPQPSTQGLPKLPRISETDTITKIQQDLNQINVGDIEQQFKSIDADLNGL